MAATVARIRRYKRIPYTELSERLSGLGRPIPVLGLRRIERGERRVDVDELAALAVALEVPPVLLLFPVGQVETVEVLPGYEVDVWWGAKWFRGDTPFPAQAGKIRDMTIGDWRHPTLLPIRLYQEHDQHWEVWQMAKTQAALALARGQSDTGEQRQLTQETYERQERQARSAEEELAQVRRVMFNHRIQPPALHDPQLKYLEEREATWWAARRAQETGEGEVEES